MLIDAIETYKNEFESAKNMHPNNVNISQIEQQISSVIHKLKQNTEKTDNGSRPQTQTEDRSEPEMGNTTEDNDEIDPYELEQQKLIEYLHSSQGIRDMNDYMDDMSAPSFSLGVDSVLDVCKEINKEHGDINVVEPHDNDLVTPAPQQQEKKSRRKTRLGAAYRSPYFCREIDLNEKYSTQDYAVWRWLIQEGKDKQ